MSSSDPGRLLKFGDPDYPPYRCNKTWKDRRGELHVCDKPEFHEGPCQCGCEVIA